MATPRRGILNANFDPLRGDALRSEKLATYDPLSPESSKVVKTYDRELGFAVHPAGEREAIDQYRSDIDTAVGTQRTALQNYNASYTAAMRTANQNASRVLSQMAHSLDTAEAFQQERIAVSITGNGQIESTHYVNRDWAEKFLPQLQGLSEGLWSPIRYDNGSWSIDAAGYGKELREAVMDAEAQTNDADAQYQQELSEAKRRLALEMRSAQNTINSQRRIAEARHTFEVTRANALMARTQGLWTTYLANSREAFQRGMRDNTGGIRDLLASGALTFKGGSNDAR